MRFFLPALTLFVSLAACSIARDGLAYPRLDEPSRLATSPEGRGLVVVDCRIEERSLSGIDEVGVVGGALERVTGGERLYAAPRGELLVFDDVPPGEWRLASVRGAVWRSSSSVAGPDKMVHDPRTYQLPTQVQTALVVRSGQVTYLGRVTVANARSQADSLFELSPSHTGERRACQRLLASFPTSPWAPVLERRISEL